MQKVISFCIFGDNIKYTEGLLENLQIIKEKLIDYITWIYIGNGVPIEYINKYKDYNVVLNYLKEEEIKLTAYRIFPIDNPNVEILFSRDADSRINERDLYCMNEFINSDKKFHIIRDNIWHKQKRICGGLFGIKKGLLSIKVEELYKKYNNNGLYGDDEIFLENFIYPIIKNDILVHSDIISYEDEEYPNYIKIKNDGFNFVGNVYDISINKWVFNYYKQLNDDIVNHLNWLVAQKSWNMVIKIFNDLNLKIFDEFIKYKIFDILFMSYYYSNNIEDCRKILSKFEECYIDEHIINNSNFIFDKLRQLGYKIIGTTNIDRLPNNMEIIIIYGNYHHSIENLPYGNLIKRHSIYYDKVKHDIFEYNECWASLNKIYILNLEERVDRYMEIMIELSRMNAPLNKIYHYKAKKEIVTGDKNIDPHLGACKNHIDVIEDFLKSDGEYCIIFEDDVTFTSDIKKHQQDLKEFFDKKYSFDVLLLLSSKYWTIEPYDELVSLSKQLCTTTACYILSKEGANKILPIFKEGYTYMSLCGGSTTTYAVDRYWSKIQKDNKFFVMKNKFGYQRCNYSSITGNNTCHFD